jgi:hypothetical protein
MERGYFNMLHAETQKITAHIPTHLLHDAQEITGKGITETIKAGLEQLTRMQTYENLRHWRGKVKFSINLSELRKDKNEK